MSVTPFSSGVALFAALTLSNLATAQTTHLVGPSGLPQIRDALAVAAPGDLILVAPGTYAQFRVTRSVRIRAITDGTVAITPSATFTQQCGADIGCIVDATRTVFDLAGGRAHVAGLSFQAGTVPALLTTAYHRVAVLGGEVTFENCSFATRSGGGALVVQGAQLNLIRCNVTGLTDVNTSGGAGGLVASGSEILAVDSTFQGSASFSRFAAGSPGIGLTGSSLHASHVTATGGSQQFGGLAPAAGLIADAACTLWLGDSSFTAGGGLGGPVPCGIEAPLANGHLSGCTVTPNAGCTLPPNGSLLTVSRPAPLHIGTTFSLQFHTDPNGLFVVLLSADLHKSVLPFLEQPWWADAGALELGYYFADSVGQSNLSWLVPNSPQFLDQVVWFHSVALTATLPLQVGPPVGCLIR